MHIVHYLRTKAEGTGIQRATCVIPISVDHTEHTSDCGEIIGSKSRATVGYSRKTTLVKGGHNPRTGEVWEPRKRKRAVHRRIRRFRNRNGYGFLVLNAPLEAIADISRLISHYADTSMTSDVAAARRDLHSGAFDDDFFGAAPDHAPRGVLALHHDFDGARPTEAQKLSRSKLDHAARDAVAAESLAFRENVAASAERRPFVNPLGPLTPSADAEPKVEQTWASFLNDLIPF